MITRRWTNTTIIRYLNLLLILIYFSSTFAQPSMQSSSPSTLPEQLIQIVTKLPINKDNATFLHIPANNITNNSNPHNYNNYISKLHDTILESLTQILDHSPSIPLSTPPTLIEHGYPNKDYTLLKRITINSTHHSGVHPTFPLPSLTPSQSAQHLVSKGFTLVINKLHRRSPPIHTLTTLISSHLHNDFTTTANLYLTPPSSTGFEPHYDYMDVLVIHLSPTPKVWTVHKTPSQVSPISSTKVPPTSTYLETSISDEITLGRGDVLYIPRGYVHHASNNVGGGGDTIHVTLGFEINEVEDIFRGMYEGGVCVDEIMREPEGGKLMRRFRGGVRWEDYIDGLEIVTERCGDGGEVEKEEEWRKREDEWRERRRRERREEIIRWGEELQVKVGGREEGEL